ncbi:MAG: MerR family transcriptional regulator [Clostridia bacterium]|nr:MerR family transcriptional regulator [Clostridia bacterium]
MNGLTVISKVVTDSGISSRTLRYWEAAGLFVSGRDTQSGWRVYDEQALERIRITDLLRRLDFSIKEIKEILDNQTVDTLCRVLRKQLERLSKTGSEMEIRREAIAELIAILEAEEAITLSSLENMLLPVAVDRKKHVVQKLQGGFEMEKVKSKFDEVRYVKLAPARAVGNNCMDERNTEDGAMNPIFQWLDKTNLWGTARVYLFNVHPTADNPARGMGCYATIPEGIEIPEQFYEKRLPGGTYAVISDYEGDPSFGWKKIGALMKDPAWEWEYDGSGGCVGLEEHIGKAGGGFYIPVMLPVKRNTTPRACPSSTTTAT